MTTVNTDSKDTKKDTPENSKPNKDTTREIKDGTDSKILELEKANKELTNERMSARRKATKIEKEANEKIKEMKEELELAKNKAVVYFRKMRKAQDQLQSIETDALTSIELVSDAMQTAHKILGSAGQRLAKKFQDAKVPGENYPQEASPKTIDVEEE